MRPIGDWSMSMTLSRCCAPSIRSWAPGRSCARWSIWASARYRMSLTRVDLPEPDTPVTQVKVPSGIFTLMPFRLCSRGIVDDRRLALGLRGGGGQRDLLHPGEEPPGQRRRVRRDLVGRAHRHHVAAVLARPGPEVDHVVGGADGLLVVLHHQHRVAQVAQALERVEEPAVVPLVEPDRRLVQDVEHARPGSSRSGWPGGSAAPRRPTGWRRARSSVRYSRPDLERKPEPLADLLEHPARDGHLALGERQRVEELARRRDGKPHHVGDGAPGDLDRERLRPEARAPAGRAVRAS